MPNPNDALVEATKGVASACTPRWSMRDEVAMRLFVYMVGWNPSINGVLEIRDQMLYAAAAFNAANVFMAERERNR